MCGNTRRPSGDRQMPSETRLCAGNAVMSTPAISTCPAVGRMRPVIARIVVVLPAPFTPEQRDHLAVAHDQVDAVEHHRFAVAGVELAQFEQRRLHVRSRLRVLSCHPSRMPPQTPLGRNRMQSTSATP